ncbi:MAG: hypothetical protein OXH09_18125 [Gammaproteobacteria bacterium]|nr:hypothetical protein [Gammaproteobacteria bacterium]
MIRGGDPVPNPAARYVRGLTRDDLTRLIGMDSTTHWDRRRALAAWQRLHDDGVIELRDEGGGVHIYGPKPTP